MKKAVYVDIVLTECRRFDYHEVVSLDSRKLTPVCDGGFLDAGPIKRQVIPLYEFCKRYGKNPEDYSSIYVGWSRELEELVGTPLKLIVDMQNQVSAKEKIINSLHIKITDIQKYNNANFFNRLKYLLCGKM